MNIKVAAFTVSVKSINMVSVILHQHGWQLSSATIIHGVKIHFLQCIQCFTGGGGGVHLIVALGFCKMDVEPIHFSFMSTG